MKTTLHLISCFILRCFLSVCSSTDPVCQSVCLLVCLSLVCPLFKFFHLLIYVAIAKILSQTPCFSSEWPTSGAARTCAGIPLCKCNHTLTLWGICNLTSKCKIKQNKQTKKIHKHLTAFVSARSMSKCQSVHKTLIKCATIDKQLSEVHS